MNTGQILRLSALGIAPDLAFSVSVVTRHAQTAMNQPFSRATATGANLGIDDHGGWHELDTGMLSAKGTATASAVADGLALTAPALASCPVVHIDPRFGTPLDRYLSTQAIADEESSVGAFGTGEVFW